MEIATRPHPLSTQIGHPLEPKACECPNPTGDPREMTCIWCGHQIAGVPLPARPATLSISPSRNAAHL